MRSVRSFFFTLAGLTFVGVLALFTASLGILFAGALIVMLLGQALAGFFSHHPDPQPVRSRARRPGASAPDIQRGMHVWNDGKGTIIDM